MTILVDIIPSKYRKYALWAPFALIGLILGVLAISPADVPAWIYQAYTWVGAALGLTAYSNTNGVTVTSVEDSEISESIGDV